jgi:2'-5' RNA ligase
MAHLLAIKVPVKRDPAWSDWAKMTHSRIKSAGIPVNRWQLLYYHMTILFLDDDACAATFTPGFAQIVKSCPALPMTIDKLDAFTTSNGAEHIIYLSSTNVPEQILTLANDARTLADGLNANYDKRPFIPHITFGHVPADEMSLDQLQAILRTFEQPAFHCVLNEAEHRYRRSNGTIKKWKLRQ